MKTEKYFFFSLFFLLINTFFYPLFANELIIVIPDDYQTIQEGIDASTNNMTITVRSGTFKGAGNTDIDFKGKSITLISENGPENTVIDCEGNNRAFYFQSNETESSILIGFKIINGTADNGGNSDRPQYGGIFCSNSSPKIKSCIIENCNGPGINLHESSAVIEDCQIINNSKYGIYFQYSYPKIIGCSISNNKVDGILMSESSEPQISKCTINNNERNGVIYDRKSVPNIDKSVITGNHENGIYCFTGGGGLIITSSIISNNFYRGFVLDYAWYHTYVVNCLITGHTYYSKGAAILANKSDLHIINCTITKNSTTEYGGALHVISSPTDIINSILWENPPYEISYKSDKPYVKNSVIQGGYDGTNVISTNPQFVDYENNDFSLQSISPCIDKADSYYLSSDILFDVVGNVRTQGESLDIGAVEYIVKSAIVGNITTLVTGKSQPVVNAKITLIPNDISTYSDNEGNFVINEINEGNYSIKIEKQFFSSILIENIYVKSGELTGLEPVEFKIETGDGIFDINSDNKTGIEEAISILQTISGM